MKAQKVAIIVLNHNGQKFLKGCFSSLEKLDYPIFEVIMVDDNSIDESVSYVKKNFPKVKILRNNKNLGAPASFNKAVKKTNAELIVKVDNDIIVEKNWLKEMVFALGGDPKVGVVGSKILQYGSDEIQDIGSKIDWFGYPINYLFLKEGIKPKSKIIEIFYASGCSMLFRKEIFEKVGGFDKRFFIYKDDLDLCWRIRLLGYKVVINLDSKMCHLSGVVTGGASVLDEERKYHTTARKRYFGERNTLRTLLKNYSGFSLLKILPLYFMVILAESVLFVLTGQFKVVGAYSRAIGWNIKNLGDTLKERRKIQRKRKVSDGSFRNVMIRGSSKLKFFLINRKIPKFD